MTTLHPFGTTITDATLRQIFAPLNQWEDKYRQLILLGKKLPTLTDERMRELAAAYMECMGIADTQYIVARHNDTEHPHLHIIYNRVKYAGRLWRIRTNAAGTSKSANSLNADTG